MEYSQVNTWGEGQVTLVAWSDTTQIRDVGQLFCRITTDKLKGSDWVKGLDKGKDWNTLVIVNVGNRKQRMGDVFDNIISHFLQNLNLQ